MSTRTIAVDFDGTLCNNAWPEIGAPRTTVINYVIHQRKTGAKVILWTNRSGELLEKAVAWCRERGIEFDAVNENLPEHIAQFGSDSRKVHADEYIDDKAISTTEIERRFSRIRINLRNSL